MLHCVQMISIQIQRLELVIFMWIDFALPQESMFIQIQRLELVIFMWIDFALPQESMSIQIQRLELVIFMWIDFALPQESIKNIAKITFLGHHAHFTYSPLVECYSLWASRRDKAGYVCTLRGDACALAQHTNVHI